MLRQYGDLNRDTLKYEGSSRAGFSGQENIGSRDRDTQISARKLIEYLVDEFPHWATNHPEGINQQPSVLQPKGGMDKIAKAFYA